MKEYLLLFRGGERNLQQQSAEQTQAHMQQWVGWMTKLQEQNLLLSAQPLDSGGRQIVGTQRVVTDGAYMEGKEVIGGYLICKSANYDAAVAIAQECPILQFENGMVEVREIKEM